MVQIGQILQSFPASTPNLQLIQSSRPLLPPVSEMGKSLNVNLEHTFGNFKINKGSENALQGVKDVLSGPRFMILIYGRPGSGKTHLLESASIELYSQGRVARVMPFSKILSTLKNAISSETNNYEQILNNYCYEANQLIIDDIGAGGSDTDFGNKILETIICARYGRQLLTLMSTNKDIASFPERVISRLKDQSTSFLILNKADDYRPSLGAK